MLWYTFTIGCQSEIARASAEAEAAEAAAASGRTGGVGNNGIKFPGNDPTVSPGEGFEWRGTGPVGSPEGAWYNSNTKVTLHPNLDHPAPVGPHWDYGIKGTNEWYRIFPDGSIEPR